MILLSLTLAGLAQASGFAVRPLPAPQGVAAEQRSVFRDAAAWSAFWTAPAGKGCPYPTKPAGPPAADFSREVVIVAALGLRSTTGFGLSLSARETPEEVEVVVTRLEAPKGALVGQMLTCPAAAIAVPKTGKPVRFVERSEAGVPPKPAQARPLTGEEGVRLQARLRAHPALTARLLVPSAAGDCRLRVTAKEQGGVLVLEQAAQLARLPDVLRRLTELAPKLLPGLAAQLGSERFGCDLWPRGSAVSIVLFAPAPSSEKDFGLAEGARSCRLISSARDPALRHEP